MGIKMVNGHALPKLLRDLESGVAESPHRAVNASPIFPRSLHAPFAPPSIASCPWFLAVEIIDANKVFSQRQCGLLIVPNARVDDKQKLLAIRVAGMCLSIISP